MKTLSPVFQRYLKRCVELTQSEIDDATPNEIFDVVLAYEGYGQHAGFHIRHMIKNIYNIDLDDLSLCDLLEGLANGK